MLLAVDVGNSNTVVGFDRGEGTWTSKWRISTVRSDLGNDWAAAIYALAARDNVDLGQVSSACICSVVPAAARALTEFAREWLDVEPLLVSADLKLNVTLGMANPLEVGADRIANAVAAWDRVSSACVVVDLGTATKVEAITRDGVFAGGSIAAGLGVSMEALTARASRLFNIELSLPSTAIGRNTLEAMRAGLVRGHLHLVAGLISDVRRELGAGVPVLITGGHSSPDGSVFGTLGAHLPDLTLDGIRLIHALNSP